MKRTRKKESNSSSASSRKRKGMESRAILSKSSTKKRSLIKGVGKSTRKRTSHSPVKVTKLRAQKTSKAKSTKRAPVVRASRKSVVHKIKSRSRALRSSSKKQTSTRRANKKIIRVLGHGQFSVDSETLRKLNAIDNSIVRRFEEENLTDEEFRMKIEQLGEIVTKKGKLLDPRVIVSSDIILPGSDLTIEEAGKIFHGEGIIPGLD
ncbi:MAG: PspA-associated protein PspAA [Nitrososphaeraceae archaeon]